MAAAPEGTVDILSATGIARVEPETHAITMVADAMMKGPESTGPKPGLQCSDPTVGLAMR